MSGRFHLTEEARSDRAVGEALASAAEALRGVGVEEPRRTAELLLAHVLGWDRVRVISHPELQISAADLSKYESLVRSRALGKPLQYLTGEQEFFGLRFQVTPDVLIPRPETEILVEKALVLLRGRPVRRLRLADAGTGSGCIAISIAKEVPELPVYATDVSLAALGVARANAVWHRVREQTRFICADLLECFPARPCLDFVLSNPPYVAMTDRRSLPVMVREYEPPVALFSGGSGLEIIGRLIAQAAERLVRGGYLLLEVGAGQSGEVVRLVRQEGLAQQEVLSDLRGIPRCVVARKLSGGGHG